MKVIATLLAAAALSGCSGGVTVGGMLIGGMMVSNAIDYSRNPTPFPEFVAFYDYRASPTVIPPLAPERNVQLHDCSKPIPEFAGNLKCR